MERGYILDIRTVISKKMKKIAIELSKLSSYTKVIIRWGVNIFLVFFALGTLLIFRNRVTLCYDSNMEFIATSIIKASFTILAEVIIGGLFIDYAFNKS